MALAPKAVDKIKLPNKVAASVEIVKLVITPLIR